MDARSGGSASLTPTKLSRTTAFELLRHSLCWRNVLFGDFLSVEKSKCASFFLAGLSRLLLMRAPNFSTVIDFEGLIVFCLTDRKWFESAESERSPLAEMFEKLLDDSCVEPCGLRLSFVVCWCQRIFRVFSVRRKWRHDDRQTRQRRLQRKRLPGAQHARVRVR